MDSQNTPALVSLGAGLAMVALVVFGTCIGFIPFIGLITLLFYPINWILTLTAIIAGVVGLRQAGQLNGDGQFQSIVGIILGVGYILLHVLIIGLMFAFGGFSILSEYLNNM
ncbi:MAG: hypothetical protein AAFS10_14075 [Myxococcota bacterium]